MSKVTWFEIYKCLAVRMLSPRSYAVECGPCRRGYGSVDTFRFTERTRQPNRNWFRWKIRNANAVVFAAIVIRAAETVLTKAVVTTTIFHFIRFRLDCSSTALRPFDDLRYDRRATCVGCCTVA